MRQFSYVLLIISVLMPQTVMSAETSLESTLDWFTKTFDKYYEPGDIDNTPGNGTNYSYNTVEVEEIEFSACYIDYTFIAKHSRGKKTVRASRNKIRIPIHYISRITTSADPYEQLTFRYDRRIEVEREFDNGKHSTSFTSHTTFPYQYRRGRNLAKRMNSAIQHWQKLTRERCVNEEPF